MLLALTAFVASINAFAVAPTDANSSWSNVFADHELSVVAPYANQLGANGIFGACATASEIKSLKPQKVCVQMVQVPGTGSSDTDYPPQFECARYEQKILSIPRKGLEDKCVEYGYENFGGDGEYWVCKKSGKVAYDIGLTQSVDVIYGSGERFPSVAFTKEFMIPACAQ